MAHSGTYGVKGPWTRAFSGFSSKYIGKCSGLPGNMEQQHAFLYTLPVPNSLTPEPDAQLHSLVCLAYQTMFKQVEHRLKFDYLH